jgi:AAA+ superfamily predicted ATPase
MADELQLETDDRPLTDVLQVLQRLDRMLEQAIAVAQSAYGAEAFTDYYRGLHISQSEVDRLLMREPGAPVLYAGLEPSAANAITSLSRFGWLERVYRLSPFEMDVIVIALAPEFDLRYERLYAYLQDNVTRKRPTVDLALNLLSPSIAARLRQRVYFAPDAPLIRYRLLHLSPDPNQAHCPLLAHSFRLDEQIVRLLLNQEHLDRRLAAFCQRLQPAVGWSGLPLKPEVKQALCVLANQARQVRQPLQLYFQGAVGVGKQQTAEALATEVGMPLLVASLDGVLANSTEVEQIFKILFREAWFQDAVLYLDVEALSRLEPVLQQHFLNELIQAPGIVILAGTQPWTVRGHQPAALITLTFSMPDFSERRNCWETTLAAAGISLEPACLEMLADRFRLLPAQITQAVAVACRQSHWRSAVQASQPTPQSHQPTLNELFTAARAQSGHELAALATKLDPVYTWQDLVLPEDALTQLHEICQRVAHRHQVLETWGFDRKLSLGKGVNALFAGASGTGKTMAAEVIANELGLDLYKIDLSGVVSKYIGETEKNLERIFRAAEDANVILFFDEADALFGKRSEVRDSHDRYANLEISYLLQKMEQYEGIAILATNLRGNLDEAFVRRLAFTVHFPSPDSASRRQIWAGILPAEVPLTADVDLDFLSQQFNLSGGNIKNIALAAAYLAAADDRPISMSHLRQATRREYQKLGKVLSESELNGTQGDLQL